MKTLNFHHLLYFRTVATHRSFSKAAKVLHIGQPALSMQIKALEETLECTLFERKREGLLLTNAGEKVLIFANRIHDSGQDLLAALQGTTLPLEPFHLGAMESIPKSFVAKMTEKLFASDLPHRLTIQEGSQQKLMRELKTRHLDAAIFDFSPRRESGISAQRITHLNVFICAHKKYLSLKQNFPSSLQGAPLIIPPSHAHFRSELDHYFLTRKIFPNYVVETFDSALQKLLAIRGIGLVALSATSTDEFLKTADCVKLGKLEGVHKEIWIVHREESYPHPLLAKLLKI